MHADKDENYHSGLYTRKIGELEGHSESYPYIGLF